MTVKEFKDIIDEMEVENGVEIRMTTLKLPVIHMVSI